MFISGGGGCGWVGVGGENGLEPKILHNIGDHDRIGVSMESNRSHSKVWSPLTNSLYPDWLGQV